MKFVIDTYIPGMGYVKHSSHTSYAEAKREINSGWSMRYSRRLKVVDERVLYKVKAGKYMVDSEAISQQHKKQV